MPQYLGLAKETTFGQYVSPNRWFNIRTESIKLEKETIRELTIAHRVPTVLGKPVYKVTGGFETVVEPKYIGALLEACLGSVTTTSDGGTPPRYKHEFTPSETLPSLSIEVGATQPNIVKKCSGVGVKSMEFDFAPTEIVTCSVDIVGKQLESATTLSTPSFSNLNPFVSTLTGCQVLIDNSVVGYVEALTLRIENTIDEDYFVIGSPTMPRLSIGDLRITGSMDITVMDTQLFNLFISGSKTSGTPSENIPSMSLVATLIGDSTGGSGEYAYYTLKFELGEVVITSLEWGLDRRERKVYGIEFESVKWDLTNKKPIKVTLVNKEATP